MEDPVLDLQQKNIELHAAIERLNGEITKKQNMIKSLLYEKTLMMDKMKDAESALDRARMADQMLQEEQRRAAEVVSKAETHIKKTEFLEKRLEDVLTENASLVAKLEESNEKLTSTTSELNVIRDENRHLLERVETLGNIVEEKSQDLSKTMDTLEALELNDHKQKTTIADHLALISKLQGENNALREDLGKKEQILKRNLNSDDTSVLEQLMAEVTSVTSEKCKLEKRVEELVEQLRTTTDYQKMFQREHTIAEELQATIGNLNRTIYELNEKIRYLEQFIAFKETR